MLIPPNSLVLGVPGRVTRATTDEDRVRIRKTVQSYVELQERYRRGEIAEVVGTARLTAPERK
jgi:carbonic anhydrase/acetyltransferase-like protein (isoleucine patch superfamily)